MKDLEGKHSYWEVWSKEFNVLLMMMIIVSMPYCTVRCMKSLVGFMFWSRIWFPSRRREIFINESSRAGSDCA